MRLISDPRFFNWLILILFAAASIRWAFARNWTQSGYWASALLLNIFVTCGAGGG
jgi:hypothetical protein